MARILARMARILARMARMLACMARMLAHMARMLARHGSYVGSCDDLHGSLARVLYKILLKVAVCNE